MRSRTAHAGGESAERYRSIFETAVDAIITIDEAGRVDSINPAGERMFGWSAGELFGRNVSVLMPEPDRSAHDGHIRRYLETGEPRIIGIGRTVAGLRRDGSTFPIRLSVGEMEVGGRRMFTGIVADVSDLQRAERSLLEERDHVLGLLDAMQDGLSVLSPGGVMIEVNREFCAMTGFSRDELLGSTPPYPYWDADPEAIRRGFERIRREGAAEWDLEFRRKDGSRFPVILKGSPLPDPRDEVTGYLATVKDVTERRLMERARDDFVVLASHELRTPLTSVVGYLDLLLDEDDPVAPEHRGFIEIAARNAARLARLVDDLVLVARADAGRLGMMRTPVDLGEIAAEAVETARRAGGPGAADLVGRIEPTRVFGDRERLAQLCECLLSNARKFTPAGGRICVRVGASGGRAEVVVDDSGLGIPPAERERVFERFYRGAAAREAEVQGAGLGLAIAGLIVEAHGGRIEICEREGPGTMIRVDLPLADAAEGAGV
jgi:PAS domain S-box-containing protein